MSVLSADVNLVKPPPPEDWTTNTSYVIDQLTEAIEVDVVRHFDLHPFGSTLVREEHVEFDLPESVFITPETELIPLDLEFDWSDGEGDEARALSRACHELAEQLESLSDPIRLGDDLRRNVRAMLWAEHPFCSYCRRRLTFARSTIDHVVPLSQGGDDSPENLRLCCRQCNESKAGLTSDQFASFDGHRKERLQKQTA